jgi:transcriptional regulator
MYVPHEFSVSDLNEIAVFLQYHSFGIIVSNQGNFEPIATHLPFVIKKNGDQFILEGHLSKHNHQTDILKKGKKVMVIFQGPHAYVSSSVYTHVNVPTWNYQAVHLYGTIDLLDKKETERHLKELVETHEADRDHSFDLSTLSAEMLATYQNEIVCFKIESYRVEAAFKLSQNRNYVDYERIIDDLSKDKKNRPITVAMDRSRKSDNA